MLNLQISFPPSSPLLPSSSSGDILVCSKARGSIYDRRHQMSRCGRSTFSTLETRLRSRRRNRPRCMPRVCLLLMPITDTRSPPFSSSYSLLQTSLKSIFRSTSSAFLLPFTSLGASGRSSSLKTEAWSRCCPPHAPSTPYPPHPSPHQPHHKTHGGGISHTALTHLRRRV